MTKSRIFQGLVSNHRPIIGIMVVLFIFVVFALNLAFLFVDGLNLVFV